MATNEKVEEESGKHEGCTTNASQMTRAKVEKDNRTSIAKSKDEGDESTAAPQIVSLKNRRKIRQPKQYKPKCFTEESTVNGEHEEPCGSSSESPGFATNTKEIWTAENDSSPTLVHKADIPGVVDASAAVEILREVPRESSFQNEVHVMTACQVQKQVESTPLAKSASSSQKPKRSGNRAAAKKVKHQAPPMPKKPEELIREAMIMGQSSPQATKRDAQYRKSYAYKIWKERANCEVKSGSTEQEHLKPGTKKGSAHPLVSPRQQRAQYYWPPNQRNGFYAQGKYYQVSPQVPHSVQGSPKISQNTTAVPQISPIATTAALPVSTAVSQDLETGRPKKRTYTRGKNAGKQYLIGKDSSERKIVKRGPPNVVVLPKYPAKVQVSLPVPTSSMSPVAETTMQDGPEGSPKTGTIIPGNYHENKTTDKSVVSEEDQNSSRSAESTDEKPKVSSTSPSHLVSIMKSSLKRKHCKENVQPSGVSLRSKLKTKRKLETDKNNATVAKKSAKPTIFTPLNEQDAEKLANDIYDVNLEYFPFQTLAERAAQNKEDASAGKTEQKDKVTEIERVRCLLKDFYDITYSCTEDPDMQKFDSASRKFGRKNILNHLSLLDRYFAELQKKVDCSA